MGSANPTSVVLPDRAFAVMCAGFFGIHPRFSGLVAAQSWQVQSCLVRSVKTRLSPGRLGRAVRSYLARVWSTIGVDFDSRSRFFLG